MLFSRESGILLHPTSLPGAYGIGEIGAAAIEWVETLARMGQHLWQVLPLGPTGYADSPYQSLSTFAGSPLLLSLESLVADELLAQRELEDLPVFPADKADFGWVIPLRSALLRQAAAAFADTRRDLRQGFDEFCVRHAAWLDDWALFDAVKQAHEGRVWTEWPAPLRDRDAGALAEVRRDLRAPIEQAKVLQYLFERQWNAVRARAHALGVRLIGDIPIFVAHDSADVWQRRDLFHLDDRGEPTVIAGVPPDYFSETGQRWGNPLYRWEAHAADDYRWWAARVRRTLELVDVVRIDHFRGFAAYWEIPASEPTAIHGRWVPGPGIDLFRALTRQLGELPIIAEDLGLITPDVIALRDELAFPGMRVLQFAFGGDAANPHHPGYYVPNCVAYTGTHDNDTIAGWLEGEEIQGTRSREDVEHERARVRRYLRRKFGNTPDELHWACIELVLRSRAGAAVVPLQDVLGLGSEARMNTPGKPEGNWAWRFRREQVTPEICERLGRLSRLSGR